MPSYEEMFDEYVRSSAEYCCDLFKTAELFFAANSALESIIAEHNTPSINLTSQVRETFSICHFAALKTFKSLKYFKHVHLDMPGDQLIIDFQDQMNSLQKVISTTSKIVQLFDTVNTEDNLQNYIWENDNFTRYFTETAEAISSAILWQCSFAKKANLDATL